MSRTCYSLHVARMMHYVINNILKNELWTGRTANDIVKFLQTAGMSVDAVKVGAWKRDRVPSLDNLAEIEQAHGLPRGWILWRAGYIDVEALVAIGDTPPAPVTIVTQTPAEISLRLETLEQTMAQVLAELRAGS